jgi:anhydro-N-acetylmuramic acid kinase
MNHTHRFNNYHEKKEHLLIGIMSGTSLDGIDTALVQILMGENDEIEKVNLKAFDYFPYSDELREQLLALCSVETAKLNDLVIANFGVSEWYAHAVNSLLVPSGTDPSNVEALCCHGQTIWHAPTPVPFPGPKGELQVRATLQIGSLSVLAERTGIPVIGDFRSRDMAAGGEGAPLVPYVDAVLFGSQMEGRIMQNIGGIGNATVLPAKNCKQEIFAYDTGPGNMVMDSLVYLHTKGKERFDSEGKTASTGHVNSDLLGLFLQDPFYQKNPPKSTGREVYGLAFAKNFLTEGENRNLPFEDILATATALTAKSITESYKKFILPTIEITEVIVSGGGSHNTTLVNMIKEDLPASISVKKSAEFGIPDDAKEAVAFAILGHETLMRRPSNLPIVTGASHPVILGNICY